MKRIAMKGKSPLYLIIFMCTVTVVISGCNKKDAATSAGSSAQQEAAAGKTDSTEVKVEKAVTAKTDPAKVLVEVNGKKFTQGEADNEINSRLSGAMGQIPETQMEALQAKMLKESVDDFVTRTLLTEAAERGKITVSDAEINSAIDKIKTNLPKGMSLQDAMKQSGITEEKLHAEVSLGLRINKIIDAQLKDKKGPSEKEIKDYYNVNKKLFEVPETVHARHVLLKTEEKDDKKVKEEKKTKIEGLRKQLVAGADFTKIAKENSDCPSKEKGGDLGTFGRGQMAKPFEDAAFSQKVKDIGPIIETQFGYHIIQVLEHNQPKTKQLDEVKDKIADILQRQKLQETAERYIADLKTKAKIVYADTVAPAAK